LARTQAADYEVRRDAITAAAAVLFAKKGFLGASVADLSAACNISKSLIYHYFPAKEDILFAVMWGHVSMLVEFGRQIGSFNREPEYLVGIFARGLMDAYVNAGDAQKILLNEMDNLPPDKRTLIVHAQREVMDVLDKLLIQIRPQLKSQPKQRRPIVMLFFGMLNWTHTWLDPKGPMSPNKVAELATEIFLYGLPRKNV
jgi:AcrR family transcriptional regulator